MDANKAIEKSKLVIIRYLRSILHPPLWKKWPVWMVQDWILAGQDVMAVQGLSMPHDTMAKRLAIFSFDYPTIKIYFDVQAYLSYATAPCSGSGIFRATTTIRPSPT